MDLPTIKDLKPADLKGKRVIVRVDFNVPIKNGRVVGEHRIIRSLPTISFLAKAGARIILISHLGDSAGSLKPVALALSRHLKAGFIPSLPTAERIDNLADGGVVLLENLRQEAGEEKNSLTFARRLARLGDIYVNDAFSVSHRAHASIVRLPKLLPAYAGLLFLDEYTHLAKIFSAEKPFVLILGGAKFSTKLPLVKKYLSRADQIFITGALAHSFFHQKGFSIGQSLVEKKVSGLADLLKNKKLKLPIDLIVRSGGTDKVKLPTEVESSDIIFDAGPATVATIGQAVAGAKTVLWNGPLGNFENGYDAGTKQLAQIIGQSQAFSVVGGGDTVAAIEQLSLVSNFDFISTAGGAMLEFLAEGHLPGLEALTAK
ncbi:MAG: phosphoglycerate kinase [Candidatus Paceibacterota bacterium]